jgi:hypothetical protein
MNVLASVARMIRAELSMLASFSLCKELVVLVTEKDTLEMMLTEELEMLIMGNTVLCYDVIQVKL